MDHLWHIIEIIRDLLGNLNPFKLLFSRHYRREFMILWKNEAWGFRLGYIFGSILLTIVMLSLLLLFLDAIVPGEILEHSRTD